MDFLVSEADPHAIVTESLNDETYPGLSVFEMTDVQKEAVSQARERIHHLSPITSEEEESSSESESETEIIEAPKPPTPPQIEIVHPPPIQETMPTPDIRSKVPEDAIIEELKIEVNQLRKKVAISANMKSLMNRLEGVEDLTQQMEVIKNYSRRRFNIIVSNDDFEALTSDQIKAMYTRTRESEKSDKFELIYKTVFDFGVSSLEQVLNKYFFRVENLSQYLLYDDISYELTDIKGMVENTVIGQYVDHTSPLLRILSHVVIQVARAKLTV